MTDAGMKASAAVKKMSGTGEAARNTGVMNKSGDETLTIDRKAEDLIIEILARHAAEKKLKFTLITEETGYLAIDGTSGENIVTPVDIFEGGDFIIADPVDGSKNAAFGFPMWAVSLAHGKGKLISDVTEGVIINGATSDVYTAVKNGGTYKNGVRIRAKTEGDHENMMFGLSLSLKQPISEFIERYAFFFPKKIKIRAVGTNAIGVALVADGTMAGYAEFQRKCRPFDIAAGFLILEEAGGRIFLPDPSLKEIPAVVDISFGFMVYAPCIFDYVESNKERLIEAHKREPDIYKAPL